MIPYKQFTHMHLGPIEIQVWGLLVALGVVVSLLLALRRAKKVGIKKAWVYDLTFYSILSGLIGSRIGYILFSWPADIPLTLLNAVNITKGGLSFTFGLATAAIVDMAYMKMKKINVLRFADFMVPYIALAHAIGRVGCFLIGDHIGRTTDFFLGVMIDGAIRHNTALYEIIILLLIFTILIYLRKYKKFDGMIFASYLMLYPLLRFPIDSLRVDPTYYGLTAAQYVLMILFAASGIFMLVKTLKRK